MLDLGSNWICLDVVGSLKSDVLLSKNKFCVLNLSARCWEKGEAGGIERRGGGRLKRERAECGVLVRDCECKDVLIRSTFSKVLLILCRSISWARRMCFPTRLHSTSRTDTKSNRCLMASRWVSWPADVLHLFCVVSLCITPSRGCSCSS